MHATAYLKKPDAKPCGPMVAVYGSETYLRQRVVDAVAEQVVGTNPDDEMAVVRFPGKTTDLVTVLDELRMVSMWGDRRLVVVEEGDDFVKNHRGGLEKYLQSPAKKSVLLLMVSSWPSNTKLAKGVAANGLDLDCGALKGAELLKWIPEQARSMHQKEIGRDAAQLLIELVGSELTQIEQELAKLATFVGDQPAIGAEDVRKLVGGWKAETTWGMLDAVRDGNIDLALHLLDKLLTEGEHPLKLLGGINYMFRGLAAATESARQGLSLREALTQAGVKSFTLGPSEAYLRRVGRPRAELLYRRLLDVDAGFKGRSPLPDRVQMEQLVLQLAGKL